MSNNGANSMLSNLRKTG